MSSESRYPIALCIVATVIVLPGGVARLFGASLGTLTSIAAFQLFATLVFFITTIVSIVFAGQSAIQKKWKKVAVFCGVALLPFATWMLVAITNLPGFEGVMSV